MKIFLPFVLIFMLLGVSVYSTPTDSLRMRLAAAGTDTDRIGLMNHLANVYLDYKPDSAFAFAAGSATLARQIKFRAGEISSLIILGSVFEVRGNYSGALEMYLQALKAAEDSGDQASIMVCYSNIGLIFNDQGDNRQALDNTLKAKKIAEAIHNSSLILTAILNIGNSYEKMNRLDSARLYTQQAYELAVKLHSVDSRGIALCNLGNINSRMKQPDIAMSYYRLSIADFQSQKDFQPICEASLGMATLFQQQGKADSALFYARYSRAMASNGGFLKDALNVSTFLTAYYKKLGKTDSAFYYAEIAIAAKDSLFSQEKNRQLQNLSVNEQIRQQERAVTLAEASESRRKNIQMAGIGVFIPAFFGFVLVFSKRKVRPRTIEFLGLLGLLFLFEFVALVIHPYIDELTHHTPVQKLIASVLVASVLVPMHHRLEKWVRHNLVRQGQLAVVQASADTEAPA